MKRIFYYGQKLLTPALFSLSMLLIITSFITDESLGKLALVAAILILMWIGKNQMELKLKTTSRKLVYGKQNHLTPLENDIAWSFSNRKITLKEHDSPKNQDLNFEHLALKQDINDKKHTKIYPKQFTKHGIEVAQLESNDSYSIAKKAISLN
jgi:hypothetical protein